MHRYTQLILQATILIQPVMATSPTDECDIDLRVYSSSSNCLTGFSSKQAQLFSITADGECHDSGKEDLGYYIANCDTNSFQLSRSGCTDDTCSDCSETSTFSGKYQEGGCMVDWSVSDLDKSGSLPFSAVADGECHDSGIDGLGHYVASCHDDGDWFQLSQSSCTNETCSDCTGTSDIETSEKRGSPLRNTPLAFVYEKKTQCDVDAFYREQVWSIIGSCQRPGCSAPTLPAKRWPNATLSALASSPNKQPNVTNSAFSRPNAYLIGFLSFVYTLLGH